MTKLLKRGRVLHGCARQLVPGGVIVDGQDGPVGFDYLVIGEHVRGWCVKLSACIFALLPP